jgi:hypothetical protein
MNTEVPPARRAVLNPWPVSIIVFFAIAIIGCTTLVTFCSRHPADLVAADYYEQEIRYQGRLDRLQHASQPDHQAAVSYDSATRLISISLPHGLAHPKGDVQLYRPSAGNLDRQLKLQPSANGLQTIDATTLAPGLWRVRVSWTVDQQDYFVDQKIIIEAKSS